MNVLHIEGGSPKQRQWANDAVSFALDQLLPRHRSLEITVVFKNLKGVDGWCMWEDDNVNPREFTIMVYRGFGRENVLKTVLHEMVHVKQYAKGELQERYKFGHKQLWKGKDCSDVNYWDQPWEVEAYKLQDELYDKFENI